MKHILKKAFLFSSLLALTSFGAQSAKAGFEWRPPQDNQTQNNQPQNNQGATPSQTTPLATPTQMMPIPVVPVEQETAVEVPQRMITPVQPLAQPSVQKPVAIAPVIAPVQPAPKPIDLAPITLSPVAPTTITATPVAPKPALDPVQVQNLNAPISPPDAPAIRFATPDSAPVQIAPTTPRVAAPKIVTPATTPVIAPVTPSAPIVPKQMDVATPVETKAIEAKPFNDNVIVRPIERPVDVLKEKQKAEAKSATESAPQKPIKQEPVKKEIKQDVKSEAKAEVKTETKAETKIAAPRVLPPVKHMNSIDTAAMNKPFRVKRDTVPALYGDEAPIVLGKTPRERKLVDVYPAQVLSSSDTVVIFDPDADVAMPRYSAVETPKEFSRGFDNDVFSPSSASVRSESVVTSAPQSILRSEVIVEEVKEPARLDMASVFAEPASAPMSEPTIIAEPIPAPVSERVSEQVSEPVGARTTHATLKNEDFQSPLPIVSRPIVSHPGVSHSVIAQPVETPREQVRDFAPVAPVIEPQFQPVQVAAAQTTASLMPVPTDGTVQGFGKRVPLVIAVRQIAPENYEFDFADNVDMGALVDWEGGQSWNNVMDSTLGKYGLVSSVNETTKVVSITKEGRAPAVMTTPVMPASASFVTPMDTSWTPQAQPTPITAPVAPPVIERQVEPNLIVPPMPLETAKENQATLISNNADFGSTRVIQTQKDKSSAAPVVAQQELTPVAYQQAPATPVSGGSVWYGAKDATLRSVLRDWASKANVELYWDSQFDYPLQATVVVEGTFEEAVQRILEGFEQAQPRPLGRLHKNTSNGPSVLIVEANDLLD